MKKVTLYTKKNNDGSYQLKIDSFETDYQYGNLFSLPDNANLIIKHEDKEYAGIIAIEKGVGYAPDMWHVKEYKNIDKINIPENCNLEYFYSYGIDSGMGIIFHIKIKGLTFVKKDRGNLKIIELERN